MSNQASANEILTAILEQVARERAEADRFIDSVDGEF